MWHTKVWDLENKLDKNKRPHLSTHSESTLLCFDVILWVVSAGWWPFLHVNINWALSAPICDKKNIEGWYITLQYFFNPFCSFSPAIWAEQITAIYVCFLILNAFLSFLFKCRLDKSTISALRARWVLSVPATHSLSFPSPIKPDSPVSSYLFHEKR